MLTDNEILFIELIRKVVDDPERLELVIQILKNFVSEANGSEV